MNDKVAYKIGFYGRPDAGKTSIIRNLAGKTVDERSNLRTSWPEFKIAEINGHQVELYDEAISGGSDTQELNAAVLVFNAVNPPFIRNLEIDLDLIRDSTGEDTPILLLGNKIDRPFTAKGYGTEFAEKNGLLYADVSALTGKNIKESFEKLVDQLSAEKTASETPGMGMGRK